MLATIQSFVAGKGGLSVAPAAPTGSAMVRALFESSSLRRRAPALLLTLLIEVLLLLALLVPFSAPLFKRTQSAMITIPITPLPKQVSRAKAVVKVRQAGGAAPPKQAQPPVPHPPPVPTTYVEVTKKDFDAGDISKLSTTHSEGSGGTGHAAAYGPGEGPGGAPLYNAEWYVEPTPGELALYLPHDRPHPGWALIMCKTLPAYHVDDCRSLGESPPGSGLASALRQAAWQFKVIPPRIGGKPIIGAWVRIRFDWYERKEGSDAGN